MEDLFSILAKGMNCIYKIRPCTAVPALKLVLKCYHRENLKINCWNRDSEILKELLVF